MKKITEMSIEELRKEFSDCNYDDLLLIIQIKEQTLENLRNKIKNFEQSYSLNNSKNWHQFK